MNVMFHTLAAVLEALAFAFALASFFTLSTFFSTKASFAAAELVCMDLNFYLGVDLGYKVIKIHQVYKTCRSKVPTFFSLVAQLGCPALVDLWSFLSSFFFGFAAAC